MTCTQGVAAPRVGLKKQDIMLTVLHAGMRAVRLELFISPQSTAFLWHWIQHLCAQNLIPLARLGYQAKSKIVGRIMLEILVVAVNST